MKLYNAALSPNALRVRAVAQELDIALDLVEIDMRGGSHKTPEYLAMNPMGKVPVLVDGDFALWESRAIIGYLAALRPEAGLYPDDPMRRAIVDQWSYWQAVHLSPVVQKIVFEMMVKPMLGLGDPDPGAVRREREETGELLAVLDAALAGHDWIAGALSLADFTLASTLVYSGRTGIALDGVPNVAAWQARMEARPSWRAALAPALRMLD